jgi:hypothetical protein
MSSYDKVVFLYSQVSHKIPSSQYPRFVFSLWPSLSFSVLLTLVLRLWSPFSTLSWTSYLTWSLCCVCDPLSARYLEHRTLRDLCCWHSCCVCGPPSAHYLEHLTLRDLCVAFVIPFQHVVLNILPYMISVLRLWSPFSTLSWTSYLTWSLCCWQSCCVCGPVSARYLEHLTLCDLCAASVIPFNTLSWTSYLTWSLCCVCDPLSARYLEQLTLRDLCVASVIPFQHVILNILPYMISVLRLWSPFSTLSWTSYLTWSLCCICDPLSARCLEHLTLRDLYVASVIPFQHVILNILPYVISAADTRLASVVPFQHAILNILPYVISVLLTLVLRLWSPFSTLSWTSYLTWSLWFWHSCCVCGPPSARYLEHLTLRDLCCVCDPFSALCFEHLTLRELCAADTRVASVIPFSARYLEHLTVHDLCVASVIPFQHVILNILPYVMSVLRLWSPFSTLSWTSYLTWYLCCVCDPLSARYLKHLTLHDLCVASVIPFQHVVLNILPYVISMSFLFLVSY